MRPRRNGSGKAVTCVLAAASLLALRAPASAQAQEATSAPSSPAASDGENAPASDDAPADAAQAAPTDRAGPVSDTGAPRTEPHIEATATAGSVPSPGAGAAATMPAGRGSSQSVGPSSTAIVTADETGFSLRSADVPPAFVFKLMGTFQADGRFYADSPSKDSIVVRRARPIVFATLLGLVDLYLSPDFALGQTLLFDAYADVHPWSWLRLRLGKFKPPVGLERLQADFDTPLPERGLSSDLSPVRDVGGQLWGEIAGGLLVYALAVLDGAPDSAMVDGDSNGDKDLAGRLCVRPFARADGLGTLGVGFAATTGVTKGSAKATSLAPLRTEGQTPLFSYLAPTADAMGTATSFAAGRHSRLNPQLYYYAGSFGILGEAIWSRQDVGIGSTRATLAHSAWHVTASWVFGGRNGYTGATPDQSWDPARSHFGALELSARYGRIAFDQRTFPTFADPSASARTAEGLAVGINWVPSRLVRFSVAELRTRFAGGAGKAGAIADRRAENLVLVRAQLNF